MTLLKRIILPITIILSLLSIIYFANTRIAEDTVLAKEMPLNDKNLTASISVPASPRSGEKIYNSYCIACHGTGAVGAPIKGDIDAWRARLVGGKDLLMKHTFEGINIMPARGGCADCSDNEIIATVEFLIKGL